LALVGAAGAAGACVQNSIVLETEASGEVEDEVTGNATTGPPPPSSTTTTGPPPSPTAGPSSAVTTEVPPPPPPVLDVPLPQDLGDGCDPPCPEGEVCIGGVCFEEPEPECGYDEPWLSCLLPDGTADESLCNDDEICLTDSDPATIGICARQGCMDACDCPFVPEGIDPPEAACEDITGSGEMLCYLDCSTGRLCPEGMMCFGGFICIYPVPPP